MAQMTQDEKAQAVQTLNILLNKSHPQVVVGPQVVSETQTIESTCSGNDPVCSLSVQANELSTSQNWHATQSSDQADLVTTVLSKISHSTEDPELNLSDLGVVDNSDGQSRQIDGATVITRCKTIMAGNPIVKTHVSLVSQTSPHAKSGPCESERSTVEIQRLKEGHSGQNGAVRTNLGTQEVCVGEVYSGQTEGCVGKVYSEQTDISVGEVYSGPTEVCVGELHSGQTDVSVGEVYSGQLQTEGCVREVHSGQTEGCLEEVYSGQLQTEVCVAEVHSEQTEGCLGEVHSEPTEVCMGEVYSGQTEVCMGEVHSGQTEVCVEEVYSGQTGDRNGESAVRTRGRPRKGQTDNLGQHSDLHKVSTTTSVGAQGDSIETVAWEKSVSPMTTRGACKQHDKKTRHLHNEHDYSTRQSTKTQHDNQTQTLIKRNRGRPRKEHTLISTDNKEEHKNVCGDHNDQVDGEGKSEQSFQSRLKKRRPKNLEIIINDDVLCEIEDSKELKIDEMGDDTGNIHQYEEMAEDSLLCHESIPDEEVLIQQSQQLKKESRHDQTFDEEARRYMSKVIVIQPQDTNWPYRDTDGDMASHVIVLQTVQPNDDSHSDLGTDTDEIRNRLNESRETGKGNDGFVMNDDDTDKNKREENMIDEMGSIARKCDNKELSDKKTSQSKDGINMKHNNNELSGKKTNQSKDGINKKHNDNELSGKRTSQSKAGTTMKHDEKGLSNEKTSQSKAGIDAVFYCAQCGKPSQTKQHMKGRSWSILEHVVLHVKTNKLRWYFVNIINCVIHEECAPLIIY